MESESRPQSDNPESLKILAYNVVYPGGNTLLHRFVIDNSEPNQSGSDIYINAVLLSMSDVPANAVNALNDGGYTALSLAVLKNNLLMVKKLLSCLVNIDANSKSIFRRKYDYMQNTALHLAAELGHLRIVRELLDKGAGIDMKDMYGETALCVASKSSKHLDLVKLLGSRGADVNLRCGRFTPLLCAVRSGNLAAVEFLVSSGADVNSRDRENLAALHYAVIAGSLEIARFLVVNRADVNARNIHNRTPLHSAASVGSSEMAVFLLDQGADLRAVDEGGRTPLHDAESCRQLEVEKLLSGRGADLNARDRRDRNPRNRNRRNRRFFY